MKKIALSLLGLILIAAAAAYVWAQRHPEIAGITPPDPATLDRAKVEHGEELAGLGNCVVCHTAPGSRRFSGGLALPTPFGTIYSTNLTPDPETGIGKWSEEAFVRAMRHGVDREGGYLYPAFPYDYYARTSDEDLSAIYAYLMSLEPVVATPAANELGFPFNQRILLAGWNLLFHDPSPFEPDPSKDDEWNRGAYIVESLGHCGACHSTRNLFGAAPKTGKGAYGGGVAEGWTAPPLDASTPAPIPWTTMSLVNYLIDGWDKDHGIAGGPMRPVVDDLRDQSEDDVFAIAAYLMTLKGGELPAAEQEDRTAELRAAAARLDWGASDAPPLPEDPRLLAGAKVFEVECATCHKANGAPVSLALGSVAHGPTPDNLIRAVFHGIVAPLGSPELSMPARGQQISDAQMADLVAFIRARFTSRPAWQNVEGAIRAARAETH